MRILHTSDWHLGRTFHGASLLDEQAEALDRVVELVQEHQVELVVIAGDLYDRAIPPSPAVDLFGDTLARLRATGASVAAISGNHDSAVRVSVGDRLFNTMGVAVRGAVDRIAEPLVVQDPADGGPPVAVYLVPFLEPSVDVATLEAALADADADGGGASADASRPQGRATHDRALHLAGDVVRRHLTTLGPTRSVVVAHAFVAGGHVSDSERDLSVGGTDRVATSAFEGFDLVALGHLHTPHVVAGDRVAYSGSPLRYSFSEEHQQKSVRIIDLAPDGAVTAQVVPLDVGRPLRTLTGELASLLTDAALDDAVDHRVRAVLTDRHLPTQAMARLRERFAHAVELRHEPEGVDVSARFAATELAAIEAQTPLDLALQFWAEQQGAVATEAEHAVLTDAVAANLVTTEGPS